MTTQLGTEDGVSVALCATPGGRRINLVTLRDGVNLTPDQADHLARRLRIAAEMTRARDEKGTP